MLDILPAAIELGLLIYCLVGCIQSPEAEVRNLPRWGWMILIVLVPYAGPLAWLIAGRPLRAGSAGNTSGRGTPWPSSSTTSSGGFPQRGRGGPRSGLPSGPKGPDDDTEFLAGLNHTDDPRPPDDQAPPPVAP